MRLFCFFVLVAAFTGFNGATAQNGPVIAPGLMIPIGTRSLPLAFEKVDGKPTLTPMHHSTIALNKHTGANIAGSLAGSFFYKPRVTTELPGLHARTVLHSLTPVFYLHDLDDDSNDGDAQDADVATWAIVHATVDGGKRVISNLRLSQFSGKTKRREDLTDVIVEKLPGGWLKLTPTSALTPGEYALTPIPHANGSFATVVFDFGLDPSAPAATDAITPVAAGSSAVVSALL